MTLRYGSVCSGIEAATIAWHPLGWMAEFFAEIERFPSEVLAHHYGSNLPDEPLSRNAPPNLGDMTRFQEWPDADLDVLVGGTPCQAFSVAGLRKGLADPRGNLALTYLAIADRYRPRWVVWENVPGVLSSNGGRDFGAFLGGLGELGYGWAYRVLDAQYVRVDGYERAVPQRRRRVFVVGCLGDWRRAGAVLFEPESLSGHPAPRREAREGVAADVAPSLTASGRGVERPGETRGQDPVVAVSQAYGGGNTSGPINAAACLTAKGQRIDFEVETFVATRDVAATLTRGAESGGKGGYAGRRQEDDDNLVAHAVAPAITSNPYGDHESREGLLVAHTLRAEGFDASEDGTGRGNPLVPFEATHDVAGTMMSYAKSGGDSNRIDNAAAGYMAVHPEGWAVRRLTPTECERLQGFPDGYTAIPRGGKPAADGPRYKALGNSMAVNAMRWIGRRIEMVEGLSQEIATEAAE